MTALASYLSTFLREHLPKERRASPHTSEAYAASLYAPCALRRRAAEDQAVQA